MIYAGLIYLTIGLATFIHFLVWAWKEDFSNFDTEDFIGAFMVALIAWPPVIVIMWMDVVQPWLKRRSAKQSRA